MISVRLRQEEEELIKKYAEINNISLSELFRSSVISRIEDEYDLRAYEASMEEFKKNPVTYTLEEVERELLK